MAYKQPTNTPLHAEGGILDRWKAKRERRKAAESGGLNTDVEANKIKTDFQESQERGAKIKAKIKQIDANLEANHPKLHASLSYANPFSDLNLGMKKDKQESTPEAKEAVETEKKKGPSAVDKLKTNITTSNFVRKHRKLNMALTNMFHGTKAGKDSNVSGGEQVTPWQLYRGAVKEVKQEIRELPLFSHERREARKDFRGMYGAKTNREGKIVQTSRISEKNRLQQRILQNKRKGNNPNRSTHQPSIPFPKQISTQLAATNMSNRQINREIASKATNYSFQNSQNSTGTAGAQTFCDAKGKCTQVNTKK